MAQPSVANFFNTRKRSVVEDTKISRARKVLVLDSSNFNVKPQDGLEDGVVLSQNITKHVFIENKILAKLQDKEEKSINTNKIVPTVTPAVQNVQKKVVRSAKTKKVKEVANNKNIQQLLNNMNKKLNPSNEPKQTTIISDEIQEKHLTPPSIPTKKGNALDKVPAKIEGPSIKEIKQKMSRSGRLAELKASLQRFKECEKKLEQVEQKTSLIPSSPKIQSFKTIEVEVNTSPKKSYTPEKAYLSPKKDSTVRRNLVNLLSPTKNAALASPRKLVFDTISKPALTLPFKYRYLAELFRSIDTVTQILFNRKETITFRKLKPAVEEMLKRNLLERHIAQIKAIYPEAFTYTQQKLKVFGSGMKREQWELVFTPNIGDQDHINAEVLLERRRILFSKLLEKVKEYHHEFLMSLDPPLNIPKEKITKWHPDFDIEKVPDIEQAELPKRPEEEVLTSGKDVLEKARQMFNCNTRMEQALERLKAAQEKDPSLVTEKPKEENLSVLKGIPKALLEKVRQKQAAKALVTMTRSADKEKEVKLYARLPEIARLSRNVFVSEKKGVLPLDVLVEKLGNCHREYLTKVEFEDHLKVLAKEVPGWLVFHNMRNTTFIKLSKNADLSIVINKLENLAKLKSET